MVVIRPKGAGGDFSIFFVYMSFPRERFFLDFDFLLELLLIWVWLVCLKWNLRLSGRSSSRGHSGMGWCVGACEGIRESS
jgi:hypothetical protein